MNKLFCPFIKDICVSNCVFHNGEYEVDNPQNCNLNKISLIIKDGNFTSCFNDVSIIKGDKNETMPKL